MIIIVCIDDNNGMLFHGRRQSRDRVLRADVIKVAAGSSLWMNAYSFGQFADENSALIRVDEQFLDKGQAGEFCFVEDKTLADREASVEAVILYRWNRSYPSDMQFDIPLKERGWKLVSAEDFEGNSHEKITKETYRK